MHAAKKTLVAQGKPPFSALRQRRPRRIPRDPTRSIHASTDKWPTRSAGGRPSAMSRLGRLVWSVAGLAALAVVAAACTGGGSSYSGAGSSYAAPATSAGRQAAATVGVRSSALGQTLVDGQGRTLYLFEADTAGRSACNGACTSAWPPDLSDGAPHAGAGVNAALLGTSVRSDGHSQVNYHGHPLYYYAGDSRPGDAMGQGLDQFGARWYVLAPSGDKIATAN